MNKFSTRSLGVLNEVHKDLKAVALRAIEISKIDFGIPSDGGLRTPEQQNKLFLAKKSQLDGYKRRATTRQAVH